MNRGYRERPLLDEDGSPTTRAALIRAERGDQGEYDPDHTPRITIDPALVSAVVRLQGGGK